MTSFVGQHMRQRMDFLVLTTLQIVAVVTLHDTRLIAHHGEHTPKRHAADVLQVGITGDDIQHDRGGIEGWRLHLIRQTEIETHEFLFRMGHLEGLVMLLQQLFLLR